MKVGRMLGEENGVVGGAMQEEWGAFDVSHWGAEMESYQCLWISWMRHNDKGQGGNVFQLDPHMHVCAKQVNFSHVDRSKSRVGEGNLENDVVEFSAKLYGLGWGME
eukprot:3196781-Ditylum_brightwellii.AAC.1